MDSDGLVTVFLGGDVMTGRGIDQILPHPGDPRLWEPGMDDARAYVRLAEAVNGTIPRPVDMSWPWGDALAVLDGVAPDARVINLETSVTGSPWPVPGKMVHYRMSPANVGCLSVARPDVCALANNHVLDFGEAGLDETLRTLAAVGIPTAGAGRDAGEAARPVAIDVHGGRVVVFSVGDRSSGIPDDWAATGERAGVDLLPDISEAAAAALVERVRRVRRPGDVVVVSVHWGGNWGYRVAAGQRDFAHRLVDGGVAIVHGHSSHHPRPIEVYRGGLILYGCGDLIDDYEGIAGYERYRDDLRLLYLAAVERDTGRLAHLRMVAMQANRMRLRHAASGDVDFLRAVLERASGDFGTRIERDADGTLVLRTPRDEA